MPRCYMVKKGLQRHEGPSPCSPTEASVAPPCTSPAEHSAVTDSVAARPRAAQYAEPAEEGGGTCAGGGGGASLPCPLRERSAADTEAAHDLLSLSQSAPPPPPVVTVIAEPQPQLVPLYYTIQPTNIFILTEEPPEPVYTTVQTITPVQTVEYIPPQVSYVTYQSTEETQTDFVEYGEEITEYTVEELTQAPPGTAQQPTQEPPPKPKRKRAPYTITHKSRVKKARYDCDECGKRYATSSNLSRHKQTHRSLDSQSAKKCGECGKAYVSMPALAMHVLTHRMGHVCGVCGKQFSRPWLLRGHLRSHTGEKPYSCAECSKAFADRSNLRAHLQTHSADKKYECERCGKTFALKSYLNKHQEATCVRSDDE